MGYNKGGARRRSGGDITSGGVATLDQNDHGAYDVNENVSAIDK